MSVATICRSPAPVPLPVDPFLVPNVSALIKRDREEEARITDIWTSILANKANEPKEEPYVHPLVRRSSSLMSQRSLEVCTESLGSETGSDDYFSDYDTHNSWSKNVQPTQVHEQEQEQEQKGDREDDDEEAGEVAEVRRKDRVTVNYHCSISRRSPCRSFPPPLPSISRRDGPCFQMRPHRRDGRLVVEAVAVPSQNYLHAERQDGRLLLSFINTAARKTDNIKTVSNPNSIVEAAEEEDEEVMDLEDQEEEEEEVEVVDRGTVVEVKVSTQPQQQSGSGRPAAMKVHRSSVVINKFVSCTPLDTHHDDKENDRNAVNGSAATVSGVGRRSTTAATSAAAAAVAASSLSALPAADGSEPWSENKLLFASKRRNREELLRDMRRCSKLRKPLFIWEPCCIATSTN